MPYKRFITRVLVIAAVAVPVIVAIALASTGEREPVPPGPAPRAEPMQGAFEESPSRPGEALFKAEGLAPGDTVDGSVLVTNEGASRGMFWLSRRGFSDRQGPAGGTLSERLQVTVLDVTVPDAPGLVYTGGLTEMGARPLGFVDPGKSRIYSVAATLLPDGASTVAAPGNPFEGSATTISLEWRAIAGQPPLPGRKPAPRRPDTDERAPGLELDIPRRQRLLDTGSLVVNVTCDEACRLDATGRLRGTGEPLSAATATTRAQPGKASPVRVTFGPEAREAMREALVAGRSVPVRFAVIASDAAGNERAATRRIWLRPGS